jgi:hypothetical protein
MFWEFAPLGTGDPSYQREFYRDSAWRKATFKIEVDRGAGKATFYVDGKAGMTLSHPQLQSPYERIDISTEELQSVARSPGSEKHPAVASNARLRVNGIWRASNFSSLDLGIDVVDGRGTVLTVTGGQNGIANFAYNVKLEGQTLKFWDSRTW